MDGFLEMKEPVKSIAEIPDLIFIKKDTDNPTLKLQGKLLETFYVSQKKVCQGFAKVISLLGVVFWKAITSCRFQRMLCFPPRF